jgi:hypothetical protein
MNYQSATYQQLAVICWDDPTATIKERSEAQAELWRRTRPVWERVQVKIRRRG